MLRVQQFIKEVVKISSQHLLAQGQQCKHQNNMRNLFKVNGKSIDTRTTSRYPAGIYLLKVNNRNTRARCGI